MIYYGSNFKQQSNSTIFYKVLNRYQYENKTFKIGLNYSQKIDTTFYTLENLPYFLDFGDNICLLDIPDYSQIISDPSKNYTTSNTIDILNIFTKEEFFKKNLDKSFIYEAVCRDGNNIQYILNHKNPNDFYDLKLLAVKQNAYSILHIENPNEDIKLAAVKQNGLVLELLKNPTKSLKIAAIKQNGDAINYIKDPDDEMQMLATSQNGSSIGFIKDPSRKVQRNAVMYNRFAIDYIKNPSLDVVLTSLSEYRRSIIKYGLD